MEKEKEVLKNKLGDLKAHHQTSQQSAATSKAAAKQELQLQAFKCREEMKLNMQQQKKDDIVKGKNKRLNEFKHSFQLQSCGNEKFLTAIATEKKKGEKKKSSSAKRKHKKCLSSSLSSSCSSDSSSDHDCRRHRCSFLTRRHSHSSSSHRHQCHGNSFDEGDSNRHCEHCGKEGKCCGHKGEKDLDHHHDGSPPDHNYHASSSSHRHQCHGNSFDEGDFNHNYHAHPCLPKFPGKTTMPAINNEDVAFHVDSFLAAENGMEALAFAASTVDKNND